MPAKSNDSYSGVYMIKSVVDNKMYIGSSKNIHRKIWQHFYELKMNIHANNNLQQSFDKNGIDSFINKPIIFCEENELLRYEQYFLDIYKGNLYNKAIVAGNATMTRRNHSVETKNKIGDGNRGKKRSDETKRIIGRYSSLRGCPDDVKKKISNSLKGRIITAEARRKASLKLKGRKNWLGKNHKEDTKKKMSISAKRIWEERRTKNRKWVQEIMF